VEVTIIEKSKVQKSLPLFCVRLVMLLWVSRVALHVQHSRKMLNEAAFTITFILLPLCKEIIFFLRNVVKYYAFIYISLYMDRIYQLISNFINKDFNRLILGSPTLILQQFISTFGDELLRLLSVLR